MKVRMCALPVRTCVGCGSREVQAKLLRLQLRPGGGLVLVERPHAGRSAYVHDRAGCVSAIAKSRLLRRSLGTNVPSEGRGAVIEELKKRLSLPDAHDVRR